MPGRFSVSPTRCVQFAQGNLQYNAKQDCWRFANNQWNIVGLENNKIALDYDGWIDLFGWGTGTNPTNVSVDDSDYANYIEWGDNPIVNGGNESKKWTTMEKSDWEYLLLQRNNARALQGLGAVHGINGLILLPDDWQPIEDVKRFNSEEVNFYDNIFTGTDWDKMEKAGAIFLPAAGMRALQVSEGICNNTIDVNEYVQYWTSTLDALHPGQAYLIEFFAADGMRVTYGCCHYGQSVRLVQYGTK